MTNPKKASLVAESTETVKPKQDETVSTKEAVVKLSPKSETSATVEDTVPVPKPITTTKDKEGDVRPGCSKEKNSKKKS